MPKGCPTPEKKAAIAAGEKRYFTGLPCSRGHVVERYTVTSRCVDCQAITMAAMRAKPGAAEVANAQMKAWYRDNKDRARENHRRWRSENPDKHKARNDRWAIANPEAAREIRRSNTAVRMRRLLERIPAWVDRRTLRDVYRECPEGMEVDHFIPIAGENVCGLHVPENLQYLTPAENQAKSNTWDVDTQNAEWARPTRFWR